jgi:flagellar hook assembly protein FlgD
MEVTLQIMDLQGRVVKELKQKIIPNGYRYGPIFWDAKSDRGVELNSGVYVYSLLARLSNGKTANNSGRLILIE